MSVSSRRLSKKWAFAAIASLAAVAMLASFADARVGGGSSFGSRGSKTFTAPPTTNTAPKPAAPIQKLTQPGQSKAPPAAAGTSSRFGGWRSILMGGLLAAAFAGIFGFGALSSVLGFLLQFALIAGLVWLAVSYFRNRWAQPAMAQAGATNPVRPSQDTAYRYGGSIGGVNSELMIGSDDYDAFEKLLGEIQLAYGRKDVHALSERVTPEMLSYFQEEFDANARKGVRNEIAQPKLLQGDLAEAWREADGEYATLAMRFSIIDATIDEASGRVISGSRSEPDEVTELWTFRRRPKDSLQQWQLTAIQQAEKSLPLAS